MNIDKYIKDFYETMKDTSFDLTTFKNNVSKLRLVPVEKMNKKSNLCEYHYIKQEIYYTPGYLDIGIMHELFHAASTVVRENEIRSGFLSVDVNNNYTYKYLGLNEGYTALLDDRYFPNYDKNKKRVVGESYYLTKYFVSLLEDFIGAENMEKMYSLNQMEELESILSNFTSKKRTEKFFSALDLICKYVDTKPIPNVRVGMVCYNYCKKYIFDLYMRKIHAAYIVDPVDDELREEDLESLMDDELYEDAVGDAKNILKKKIIFGKRLKIKSRNYKKEEIEDRVVKNVKWVEKRIRLVK